MSAIAVITTESIISARPGRHVSVMSWLVQQLLAQRRILLLAC